MRAETRSHRNRVSDPGPNWIRSGEDLLKTDPVERIIFIDPVSRPSTTANLEPHPQHSGRSGNRLKLAPTLPAIDAPDSLPPIADDEDAFMPSCRAAVDLSYTGGSAGIRPAGGPWSDTARRRYVPTGDILLPTPPPPADAAPLSQGSELGWAEAAAADDEQSTGLFEPGEEPYAAFRALAEANQPRVPSAAEPARPELRLVRSVSESIEEEFEGMRAAPLAMEPRPVADAVVDWPPPMVRPTIDYPDDWSADDVGNTLIVIDPVHRGVHRARPSSRLRVVLLDVAAWLVGFAVMFSTGLLTMSSAGLVLFALNL